MELLILVLLLLSTSLHIYSLFMHKKDDNIKTENPHITNMIRGQKKQGKIKVNDDKRAWEKENL